MLDFNPPAKTTGGRTLLLSPPGLSSHPEALEAIVTMYDRNATDIQMFDRLAAGQVNLQEATYDTIMLLNDPDGTRTEGTNLLGRDVFSKIVRSLKVGGKLLAQDHSSGKDLNDTEHREAVLAGLVSDAAGGMIKPGPSATESIPLRLGKKKDTATVANGTYGSDTSLPSTANGEHMNGDDGTTTAPDGVGFINSDDDLDDDPGYTTDELIDEDTLLGEGDIAKPIYQRKQLPTLENPDTCMKLTLL